LYVDGQVLVFGVVDVDIRRVAHTNSGSYREEAETHRKRETTFKHGIDAQTGMMTWHIKGVQITLLDDHQFK
jgi:hypothetical protein